VGETHSWRGGKRERGRKTNREWDREGEKKSNQRQMRKMKGKTNNQRHRMVREGRQDYKK
jgi:hypothetical protein